MQKYFPVLIIVAAALAAAAVIYDYFKRKWAKLIVDAVKAAGAVSPETAVDCNKLEESCPGISRRIRLLLKRYSTLRRYVLCADDSAETAESDKKSVKNLPAKVTGTEKWYILPPPEKSEEDAADTAEAVRSMPYYLREGAEISRGKLILGVVLLAVFAGLLIYFLKPICDFLAGFADIGK